MKGKPQIGVAVEWNTLMDCQWENWLGITQLSDLLEIKTRVLKKDNLKAEKIKLALFFEQLEHHSALNSEGDLLYSSAHNKSDFSIKRCLSGRNLSKNLCSL